MIKSKDILNQNEALMFLYAAAICFNKESIFDMLIEKNNTFEVFPEWNLLLGQPNVFTYIQTQGTT